MKASDAAYRQAAALLADGRLAEGEQLLRRIVRGEPSHVDALHALGVLLRRRGEFAEAVRLLNAVIQLQPARAAAWYDMGVTCWSANRPDLALAGFERAEALAPGHADIPYNRGLVLRTLGRPEEALASFSRAIALRPGDADAFYNRGLVNQEGKRFAEALADYEQALALRPAYPEAENNRGLVLVELGRPEEALAGYDQALALRPDWPEALHNRGLALHKLGRLAEALDNVDRALARRPDFAEAHNSRGLILQTLKRPREAIASYDRALDLKPDYGEVYSNRGVALMELGRLHEGLSSVNRTLEIRPDDPEALMNRGNLEQALMQPERALEDYDQALAIKPDFADALNNRGNVCRTLKRTAEALASYDRAIALKPDFAQAYCNRGDALREIMRLDEALADYGKAVELDPLTPGGQGLWLHTAMHLCRWSGFGQAQARLLAALDQGHRVTAPFGMLALAATPEQQLACARMMAEEDYPPIADAGDFGPRKPRDRLRIGYFSADFHNHATGQLMAGFFEHQDRSRFEIIGFSFGPAAQDAMRDRLARCFDRFIDVRDRSDADIVALARDFGVDIAVDLKGYTKDCRPGIFSRRAAPVQVTYLGFPGTTGAGYMDYLIADPVVIPPGDERHYTESIVRLPHSYQVNDAAKKIADACPTREEAGLPADGFVYCCFNNNYKITPDLFDIWMDLLRRTPGSVLWLLEGNVTAAGNLRREAQARGIEDARLVFAKRLDLVRHLARHRLADLFLDTFYCNAHTTASDALWAGLPVLTCAGSTFAGRVGASLVHAAGLPELVVGSHQEYADMALQLARDRGRLAALRQRLADNRLSCPLFDTAKTTREIEAAYLEMWRRHEEGFAPAAISVVEIERGGTDIH